MRKSYKFLALAMATATLAAPMAACNPTGGPGNSASSQVSVDASKTQIYAYAVDNGMTSQWIKDLAEEFNALPGNEDYQVIGLSGDMDATTTLRNRLDAKTTEVNIYFGCQSNLKTMIANDQLVDISDVYAMKVDGENGKTIAEKTHNYEDLKLAWSDLDGTGIHAVPYGLGMSGMVFDYNWFLDNGLMKLAATSELGAVNANGNVASVSGNELVCDVAFGNYKVGDTILSAGKDGKYGTYDDGQYTTYAEFNTMLLDIMSIPYSYPFIYTTKSRNAYCPTVESATFMQEFGYENVRTFSTHKGQIKDKAGNVVMDVNYDNAADMFKLDLVKHARGVGAEFYYNYLCGLVGEIDGEQISSDAMVHPASYDSTGLSHRDAQDKFVSAFTSPSTIRNAAFLIEGIWFEQSEARGTIESNAAIYGDAYDFGTREFRYYLYPDTDTQISNKSVMALQDDGAGFITNNVPDSVKELGTEAVNAFIAKEKEFLAYTLTDEALRFYNKSTGNPRAFDYTMTEDDLKAMTPFQRTSYEIAHDTENVQIYRTSILPQMSLINSYGGLTGTAKLGNVSYATVYNAFGHSGRKDANGTPYTPYDYASKMMDSMSANYAEAKSKVAQYLK